MKQRRFDIQMQGLAFEADCLIFSEDDELHIEVLIPLSIRFPDPMWNDKDVTLQANALSEPILCFVSESRNALSYPPQQVTLLLKPKRSPFTIIYGRNDIDTLRFQIRRFGKGFLPVASELKTPTWIATFTSSDQKRSGAYQVEVKASGHSLSRADAKQAIEYLWQFLCFCQGHRIHFSDAVMLSDSTIVSEEFGSTASQKKASDDSWFCDALGGSLPNLFENYFVLAGGKRGWYKALHFVLYWIDRANVNEVGPDGALILLQVALERLAWHVLAIDSELSAAQMKKLDGQNAALRIAALLRKLQIPLEIPLSFEGLRRASSTPDDGPATITALRNDLIHPARQSTPLRSEDRYHASELARWYLELSILALCGYRGTYQNRTRLPRWLGDVVPVPWLGEEVTTPVS